MLMLESITWYYALLINHIKKILNYQTNFLFNFFIYIRTHVSIYINYIGGVMVSVLVSCQTKDYNEGSIKEKEQRLVGSESE
jgi:hypothetical protein